MRKIIHIDLDAFYTSVEQRDNPQLLELPVVVGGRPESRGVVAAASYQARRFGIHSAMPMRTALRLCPQLVILPLRMEVYRQLSTQIRQIFFRYTHLVEPVALDECYLDVTDNLQSIPTATQTAMAIKQQIQEQMQLTASAGVANNKFLAKIASDMEKPDGLTVIKPRQVESFLQHLPVNKMWGVGPATNKQLQQMQIQTIGQLRQLSLAELSRQWGKLGVRLYHLARGQDDQAVDPSDDRKSVSRETTFAEDLFSLSRMEQELAELSTEVAEVLRREGLRGRRVTLKVRYPNFQIQTRSQSQANGLEEEQIRQISQGLVRQTTALEKGVRLLGVSVSNWWQENSLQMMWCLECHRNPEQNIRDRADVFKFESQPDYTPPSDQLALGTQLVRGYRVNKAQLENCSICHR